MSRKPIPMLDLSYEIAEIRPQIDQAIGRVIDTASFIGGLEVEAFEQEVATLLNTEFASGCNSGTDAILLGLRALGIGPGDEVITPAFTFFATAEPISILGAVPVFVDIDPDTYNIDPECVKSAITAQTKAIIPVHLYGQPADMTSLMQTARDHGLYVLEDCAQAFGAEFEGQKVGTIGDVGAYSFFPSKTLGAFGDGGLVVTRNHDVNHDVRRLRSHGSLIKYQNEILGYNSRLDAIQAAVLRVKIRTIETQNKRRRLSAAVYTGQLEGIPGIKLPSGKQGHDHVYHQYTIRLESERLRSGLQNHLAKTGIASMVYYPVPLHQLPVYKGTSLKLPQSELAANSVLSLPIWPGMPENIQSRIIEEIRRYAAKAF